MYEIIKEDLVEKMKLILNLEKSRDGLILAEKKYINYLADSNELAIAIRKLALTDKIKPSLLQDIFMTFILPQYLALFKNEEYPSDPLPPKPPTKFPPFWNQALEDKFHFYKYVVSTNFSNEENNLGIALWSYKVFPLLEIKNEKLLGEAYNHAKDNLLAIKKLHDDLIAKLDSVYSAKKIDHGIKYQDGEHPVTDIVGEKGYLKVSTHAKPIFIGGANTRKFRLLEVLCVPNFGNPIKTEVIFRAIKLEKDDKDSLLKDPFNRGTRIIGIIEGQIKELQKKETGLNGKIKFKHDKFRNNYWVKLEG